MVMPLNISWVDLMPMPLQVYYGHWRGSPVAIKVAVLRTGSEQAGDAAAGTTAAAAGRAGGGGVASGTVAEFQREVTTMSTIPPHEVCCCCFPITDEH